MATVIDPILTKISVDSGWIGLIGVILGLDTGFCGDQHCGSQTLGPGLRSNGDFVSLA